MNIVLRRFSTPYVNLMFLFLLTLLLLTSGACGGGGDAGVDEDGDGVTAADGDCDDSNADTYPGADEQCDGKDNNCDDSVDVFKNYYPDGDGDGFGDASSQPTETCTAPAGYTEDNTDCNDADGEIYPQAIEQCDGVDQNCNDTADEGTFVISYPDLDGDGYGPVSEAVTDQCAAVEGYVLQGGDCDDADPISYPGALEICDLKDNDCDGIADDGSDVYYFVDQDGDGFGGNDDYVITCSVPPGYTQITGDCNDQDPSIYPGAEDITGDGTDQDCGGTDETQPSVGLFASEYSRIQSALDDANPGDTVFVGPGDYREADVSMAGKAITLFSTHGAYATSIGGNSRNTPLVIESGEGPDSVISRFTLTTGNGTQGGGLRIIGSSPTLDQLIVQNNFGELGAGIYLEDADPIMTRVKIRRNNGFTNGKGGGMYLLNANPVMTDCRFTDNLMTQGLGGAIYMEDSSPTLTRVEILGNSAAGYNLNGNSRGGGIYLNNSSPTITASLIAGNRASSDGGGLFLEGSSPSIINTTITGNRSGLRGGGVYLLSGTTDSDPDITNTIIALNTGHNIYNDVSNPGNPNISYSLLFNPSASLNTNLVQGTLDNTILQVDPEFVTFSNDSEYTNDDFHLVPASPPTGSGDSSLQNPDGTASSMGTYGGPEAEWSYYADEEGDGMADGWERAMDLDPETMDDGQDPDEDGVTNADEFGLHTDPFNMDTDGDGVNDGLELTEGSDPSDWYSQPGIASATARVPEDFELLQAAVDAIKYQGTITLGAGTYVEQILVTNKEVSIQGEGQDVAIVSGGDIGPTFTAIWSHVEVDDLTIADGMSIDFGGGMHLRGVTGRVQNVRFTGNNSSTGGGLQMTLVDDNLVVQYSVFDHNSVTVKGGAIAMEEASPRLANLRIVDNEVTGDEGTGTGAGMYMGTSSPELSHLAFARSSVAVADGSNPTFNNCTFIDSAVGLDVALSSATVNFSVFSGNDVGIQIDNESATSLTVRNSILSHSSTSNLKGEAYTSSSVSVNYSDLFQPESCSRPSCENTSIPSLGTGNLEVDPSFQTADGSGVPSNPHLSLSSSLINQGYGGADINGDGSTDLDADGSTPDMGAFGGPLGDGWDLDHDGYTNYFWPGLISDPATGFSSSDFDCDDEDASVYLCP